MEEKQYAVLIGTGSYPAEPGLHPLRCATRDVDGWEALLTNPARGAFHKVTTLKDRPSYEIIRAIHKALNELTRDDVLLLFYSGHGKQNLAGDLFLAATDTEVSMLSTTAVPVKAIRDLLNESPCRKIVFILDCCFSGAAGAAFTKGSLDDQIMAVGRASGTYVLTASSAVQTALEKEADEHSVFTKHLLKGIETGAADRSGTGFVTVDDMFEYARLEVMKESHQEPTLWALNKQDNVRIAKSGRQPRAERAGKIRKRLYELAADARIPDELIPEAVRILETAPEKQTKKERRRDELMDRLLRHDIGAAAFVMEWGSLAATSATGATTPPMPVPPVAVSGGNPHGAAKAAPVDPLQQRVSSPPIAPRKWQRPVLASLAAAVVLGAGYFFGVHQPAQGRAEVARIETERKRAAQQAKEEKKSYDAIVAEIGALVDGSPTPQRAAVEMAVEKYLSRAPENHRTALTTLWKERLAGLANADQQATQRAEQEKKSYDAIAAQIGALIDGSPTTQRAVVEAAVRSYESSAPPNYRKQVTELWARRDLGWQEAARQEAARQEAARQEAVRQAAAREAERQRVIDQSWPTLRRPWENSLGMKFVPVPGVSVLFGVWAVRVQDFEAFVRANGHEVAAGMFSLRAGSLAQHGDTWKSPGFAQGPTHPVCGVSWNDAQAFCAWLTRTERATVRLGAGQRYRLPTDAEWSVAVGLHEPRGATILSKNQQIKDVYPWGSQWPPPPGTGNFAGTEARDRDWPTDEQNFALIPGYRDDFPRTSPVGSFAPNQNKLCDMGGNVMQWCEDFLNGSSGVHVARGSSFAEGKNFYLWLSVRNVSPLADNGSIFFGFRCVVEVSDGLAP